MHLRPVFWDHKLCKSYSELLVLVFHDITLLILDSFPDGEGFKVIESLLGDDQRN
jgi:hypothetical protein